ncbi:ABC transporter ATP-binding protein [Roseovarius sp. 2305UL8-3]|uniref:ABC transporter ATP-binding protein n=1 Tax=Roseovarius conchicola TaxID=3121636 RepID=UPI003528692B
MADVSTSKIVKKYGAFTALHGVDLDIEDGEFIVFVGPSGSGKSTLLRCIAGLEPIESGSVRISGQDVTHVDPADRDLSMVFQNYALFPHMSCRGNLEFPLKSEKVAKPEIDTRVENAGRLLHIEQLLDRKPSELSGGQRQRVAIGRAIVKEPKVFLFDEPLSNLDAELRINMRLEITKLHRQLKNTIIYVTHDQVEAITMADRIVVLRDGRIEQIGTPHELYFHPANQFVATFIGAPQMNLVPCQVSDTGNGSGVSVTVGDQSGVSLPVEGSVGSNPQATFGCRPEDIQFEDPGKEAVKLSLVVDVIEHLGATTNIYGLVQLSKELSIEITVATQSRVVATEGDALNVWIAAEDSHLFQADGQSFKRNIVAPAWS